MNKIYHFISTKHSAVHDLQIDVAERWWQRLRGLIGHSGLQPGEAVLLIPCRFVHTAFMSFPIDLVFLDRQQKICRLIRNLNPYKVAGCWSAQATLELAAGEIERLGLQCGDHLQQQNSTSDG